MDSPKPQACKSFTVSFDVEVDGDQMNKLQRLAKYCVNQRAEEITAHVNKLSRMCMVSSERWCPLSHRMSHRARCVKYLWSVEGPDKAAVQQRARLYFLQYLEDGEYDDILDAELKALGL